MNEAKKECIYLMQGGNDIYESNNLFNFGVSIFPEKQLGIYARLLVVNVVLTC